MNRQISNETRLWIDISHNNSSVQRSFNSPVSQYERPRAVALAISTCVEKTTKIITVFTCKDPSFFTSETSELSTAKGIIMKSIDLCYF